MKGVPASQVAPALQRLFGSRSPIAVLPVGMGLEAGDRGALEAGLAEMRIIRDMPACVSGATFDWPQVVFDSAADAGSAVAVALQEASCTFTVAPTPTPEPTPTPPAIASIQGIRATPGNGRVELIWGPPPADAAPVVDYKIRCKAGDAAPIEIDRGRVAQSDSGRRGLSNGTAYECEVAAVSASGEGPWTAADTIAIPVGLPPPPAKPTVAALNQAVQISVAPTAATGLTEIQYECSGDQGATWPSTVDVATVDNPTARLSGSRTASTMSAAHSRSMPSARAWRHRCPTWCGRARRRSIATPSSRRSSGCSGLALAIGLILVGVALLRSRRRGYVLAVVDVVHTANLGYGSNLGMGFVRDPASKRVTDVVADRGKSAVRDGERFVAIDPKPYLADREYDVPSFVWNPLDNRMDDRAQTERRIAAFVAAGLDDFRIRAWTVIRGAYLRPDLARSIRALL